MERAEPGAAAHLGDALSALLDGELSEEAAAGARTHLAGCPECGAEMAALGQIRSLLRDLPPVEPPADFYRRIRTPAVATPTPELVGRGDGPERPSERGAGPERPSERGDGPERPSERGAGPERPSERGAGPERPSERGAGPARPRRRTGVAALAACAAATLAVLGLAAPRDPETSPPVGRFIEAHATAAAGGDPVSQMAPVVVPVSFRR